MNNDESSQSKANLGGSENTKRSSFLFKLFSSKEELFDLTTFKFMPLDVDEAAERLALTRKAKDNGKSDLPASDDPNPDASHKDIEVLIHGRASQIENSVNLRLLSLEERIENATVDNFGSQIESLARQYDAELSSVRDERKKQLSYDAERIIGVSRDYDDFRSNNELMREPENPVWMWYITLAAIVWVLEGIVNASFFAQSDLRGFAGGFTTAIYFAAADVMVLTLGLGPWIRYLNVRDGWRRYIVGYGSLLGCLLWVLFYNLGVSHYRDAAQLVREGTASEAWGHFTYAPFDLSDLNSWILFVLGVSFSVIALFSGYQLDDPFPGYGKLSRRLLNLRMLFEQDRSENLNDIKESKENCLSLLRETAEDARNALRLVTSAVQEKEKIQVGARKCLEHYGVCQEALIQRYRDVNRRHRKSPVPSYFRSYPEAPTLKLTGVRIDKRKVDEVREMVRGVEKFLKSAEEDVERSFKTVFTEMTVYGGELAQKLPDLPTIKSD